MTPEQRQARILALTRQEGYMASDLKHAREALHTKECEYNCVVNELTSLLARTKQEKAHD